MPCLRILTNIPKSNIPVNIVTKIVPILARALNKDPTRFTCVISGDCHVSFSGGDASLPGAVATLESIGRIGVEENKVTIKEVSEFMQKELGINPDRFFLTFYDIKGENIGKDGTTLA